MEYRPPQKEERQEYRSMSSKWLNSFRSNYEAFCLFTYRRQAGGEKEETPSHQFLNSSSVPNKSSLGMVVQIRVSDHGLTDWCSKTIHSCFHVPPSICGTWGKLSFLHIFPCLQGDEIYIDHKEPGGRQDSTEHVKGLSRWGNMVVLVPQFIY